MKKRSIVSCILFVIFFLLAFQTNVRAEEIDRIENMMVTVNPQMEDAILDIQYEITWKVLDSTIEGPLTWVQIGAPNSQFKKAKALTDNIKRIKKYHGSYVRIDFKNKYTAGKSVTFKYSIEQPDVYTIAEDTCQFEFTPAWFPNMRVDNLTVKWKADNVTRSNCDNQEEDYLIWNKTNMRRGEKLTTQVTYNKEVFPEIKEQKRKPANSWQTNLWCFGISSTIIVVVAVLLGGGGGRWGYYRHSGFYGGRGSYYRGCCACACACAGGGGGGCACAGSGRAGCSRKDFYGTNVTAKKMKQALKK